MPKHTRLKKRHWEQPRQWANKAYTSKTWDKIKREIAYVATRMNFHGATLEAVKFGCKARGSLPRVMDDNAYIEGLRLNGYEVIDGIVVDPVRLEKDKEAIQGCPTTRKRFVK